jgi:hypothetical protein
VQPAVAAASLGLGQWVDDAPVIVSQNTIPGWTTQTWVAASQLNWMPELPHEKLPWQELAEAVSLHAAAPLEDALHAATKRATRGTRTKRRAEFERVVMVTSGERELAVAEQEASPAANDGRTSRARPPRRERVNADTRAE